MSQGDESSCGVEPVELNLANSDFPVGLSVIEASAGTGKTYSISHLVPRLLIDGVIEHLGQILLVTFTKDAARELGDRVRRVLGRLAAAPEEAELREPEGILACLRARLERDAAAASRLRQALVDLDLLAVSTIHAFCQRTLQQEGSLCGLPVMPEVVTDEATELEQLVREVWLDLLPGDPLLAALATARAWTPAAAVRFLKLFRASAAPSLQPEPTELGVLRGELAAKAAHLADDPGSGWSEVEQVFGGQVPLTKAAGGLDAVWRVLGLVRAGRVDTVEYWLAVARVAELETWIDGRSKAGKAAKRALGDGVWAKAVMALARQVDATQWSWHAHLASVVPARLEALLARRRLITQDGLVEALYNALHREADGGGHRLAARLAERHKVALVDESQDTDPRQFAIFERVFLDQPDRRLILIGDPKQAIYGFRGADLGTYLRARRRARRIYRLSKTYRAPPRLVEAVNTLFRRPGALHHPGLEFAPAESGLVADSVLVWEGREAPRLTVWLARDDEPGLKKARQRERELHDRCVDAVVRLLQEGRVLRRQVDGDAELVSSARVRPGDIAILTRDNRPAKALAEALEARGVPVILNSGADVFGSEEAAELRLLLLAIYDPRRSTRLRRALATRMMGQDARALSELDHPGRDGRSRMERWRDLFLAWHELWMRRGPAALFVALDRPVEELLPEGLSRRLAALRPGGERRVTNFRHLTDLLLDASRDQAAQPGDLVRWLGQRVARANDRDAPEEHQIQLASEGDAVRVLTMYKAKGLEYDFVFCPYLAAPIREPAGVLRVAAQGGSGRDEIVDLARVDGDYAQRRREADMEEQLRLAYVALTRARVAAWTCSYSAGGRGNLGVSALDWLLRTGDELGGHQRCDEAWIQRAKPQAKSGASRHDRHKTVLGELAEVCADMAGEPWPARRPARWEGEQRPTSDTRDMIALPVPSLPPAWQVTSFSRLTQAKHGNLGSSDRADVAPASAATDPESGTKHPVAEGGPGALAFLTSPAGAAVGTAVHDWIEGWDFSPVAAPGERASDEETPLQRHVRLASLPRPAAGQAEWEPALRELFEVLREVRLPGAGDNPLAELCPQPHGSEWHFHLPIRAGAGLSPQALGECFLRHAPEAYRDYGHELIGLDGRAAEGFLQGYIDRLARVGEAWGVIDWKTNRLGSQLAAYDEAGLWRCARESHYLLQMHLYLVALRRWRLSLGEAQPTLAGAWLVFLRAVRPGSTAGVLHVNPPGLLLEAIDELLAPIAANPAPRRRPPAGGPITTQR